jgi:hypothetical protein
VSALFFISISSQAQNRVVAPVGTVQTSIVRFYPNPATNIINFDFQKSYEKGFSIEIYNFLGPKKVFEQANISDRNSINLSNFTRGVYIYQLRDRSGRVVESGKFQVSK